MREPRILILRAIEDAGEVATAIKLRGGKALCLPMHRIVPLSPEIPLRTADEKSFDALVATSAHAFHKQPPLPARLFETPLFCVGKKTALMARSAGFLQIKNADHAVETLIAIIEARGLTGKSLLYLAGMPRRPALEEWARRTGTSIHILQRYAIEPVAYHRSTLSKALNTDIGAILHFSPESARRFIDEARRHDILAQIAKPLHVCFSSAIAEAVCTAFSPQSLRTEPAVAASPDLEDLLDTAFSTFALKSVD